MAVAMVLRVEHNCCALCGAEGVPLFVLHLKAGAVPYVATKPDRTHSGMCAGCLAEIGDVCLVAADRVRA